MKRIYGMALVAAIAAAPIAVQAQEPGAAPGQERALVLRGEFPFARILQQRAELGLTDPQVARLEAIGQRLQAQNAPLIEQLRASGAWPAQKRVRGERPQLSAEQRAQMRQRFENMTPEQREALRQQMRERHGVGEGQRAQRQIPEELRPVVEQIRTNNRAAFEEVRTVLTAEQQARLRELVQQHRRGGERPGQRGGVRGSR